MGKRHFLIIGGHNKSEEDIRAIQAKTKDREDSISAHSVRAGQILFIEGLETGIVGKKRIPEHNAIRELR